MKQELEYLIEQRLKCCESKSFITVGDYHLAMMEICVYRDLYKGEKAQEYVDRLNKCRDAERVWE